MVLLHYIAAVKGYNINRLGKMLKSRLEVFCVGIGIIKFSTPLSRTVSTMLGNSMSSANGHWCVLDEFTQSNRPNQPLLSSLKDQILLSCNCACLTGLKSECSFFTNDTSSVWLITKVVEQGTLIQEAWTKLRTLADSAPLARTLGYSDKTWAHKN